MYLGPKSNAKPVAPLTLVKPNGILIHARIVEHNNSNSKSAIQMHLQEQPNHDIDAEYAEIIGRASDDTKLQIKEWIYIKNRDPILNKHIATKTGNFSRNLKMILIDHLV